jgi:glucose/mannose-6-phosphate isomerase
MHSSYRNVIETFPIQFETPFSVENGDALTSSYHSLIVCGMGGSGVVGDFLAVLYPDKHITVHKSYGLPAHRHTDALYLVVSYSGETEETRSSLDEILKQGLPVAVVTAGGKLLEEAQKAGVPYVVVPQAGDVPSRFLLGYLIGAAVEILSRVGITESAADCFAPLARDMRIEQEDIAMHIVERMVGKTTLVYTHPALAALGLFWKEILNETAKSPAFSSLLPEAHHNEVESIQGIVNPFILLLDDAQVDPRLAKHVQALERLAIKHRWEVETIVMEEEARISRLINSVICSYWVGMLLADRKGVDPLVTPFIREIKNFLGTTQSDL